MTELGYGNNAIEMETTATFDKSSNEFIINTPNNLAQKYWITNASRHAHWAVVFAQIIGTNGREGVACLLVRIRNDDMSVCKGVTIQGIQYILYL